MPWLKISCLTPVAPYWGSSRSALGHTPQLAAGTRGQQHSVPAATPWHLGLNAGTWGHPWIPAEPCTGRWCRPQEIDAHPRDGCSPWKMELLQEMSASLQPPKLGASLQRWLQPG